MLVKRAFQRGSKSAALLLPLVSFIPISIASSRDLFHDSETFAPGNCVSFLKKKEKKATNMFCLVEYTNLLNPPINPLSSHLRNHLPLSAWRVRDDTKIRKKILRDLAVL